jgi:hypothetical protein
MEAIFEQRRALAKLKLGRICLTWGAFTVLRALLRLKPKRGTVIMGHYWR